MFSNEVSRRSFVVGAAAAAASTLGMTNASASVPASVNPTITARQRFFGPENVDPATGEVDSSKTILSWFGVTNFAMAIAGNVVLLDAWVPRGEFSNYVPTSPEELAALAPSHILIGHGHFDHAADAAEIASMCGATIVGTDEHCSQIAAQATTELRTLPLDSDRTDFSLSNGVAVHSVRHLHSALRAPRGEQPPLVLVPDFSPAIEHPPTPHDTAHLASHFNDAEGGSLLYQFVVGDFVLTWHDSTGPLFTDAPEILDAMRALPVSTVQIGSIQGYNQYTNGLSDPLDYIRALRPSLFVPAHHDNWLAPLSAPAVAYEERLRQALAGLPTSPELLLLTDPADYVQPPRLTFDIPVK
ncbi:MBL fold metallo-hydrolase [Rhodococcus sp. ACPA4]|uniref:MBL fold metallo-hydrolase n=1 Tax=Rhodococcus sp. ACPA4 TaxID=2028571 RepID=UPI00117AE209|nr:MBL fold metallo-hydrolase [Rhodococcus sp. ACPA4]